MIIIGLTGSIGMGKSTATGFFSEEGIPVHSADDAVHAIYTQVPVIKKIHTSFPGIVEDGTINCRKLAEIVFHIPEALEKLEAIIHPYVREAESFFLQKACQQEHRIVLFDIPLLYETGAHSRVDYVVTVSVPYNIQRERVLSRAGMTEEMFSAILSRQMRDEEKRKRADFVIDADKDLSTLHKDVRSVIAKLLTFKRIL
ncbi:MAG: dephospho-CoA kinase [Candidatus Tokpelaia sp. JSC085]|nr:MAG: dephospho-CoA kinase [Candidatus Tokpelaia sp. JSC085]